MNLHFATFFVALISSCAGSIKTNRSELDYKQIQIKKNSNAASLSNKKNSPSAIAASNIAAQAVVGTRAMPENINVTTAPPPPASAMTAQQILANKDLSNLNKLEQLVNVSVSNPDKLEQEAARIKAIDIVNNQLAVDDLKKVASNSSYGFARGHALYRLSEDALEHRENAAAKSYLNGVIDFVPGSDLESRARQVIEQIESSKNIRVKTIGAVLPLSGKNAVTGQRALRGIQMGLGLHLPGSTFKLAVADSEGSPDNARIGTERLIKEDGAMVIIGSLLSKTAPTVAAKAEEYGVPSINLSQKTGVTEIGPTVFKNSLTSEMQIRFLVRNAINNLNLKRFAILYPNEPYGNEYANIFWDEVNARGGTIVAAQAYNPTDTDFRLTAQKIVGTYYTEGRMDEYKLRLKEMTDAQGDNESKKLSRQKNEEDVLPPIIDFDAIFIPDDAKNMGQIAAFLSYVGIKNVKLLGTNLWNTPGLGKRSGNFVNSVVFMDSIYPQLVNSNKSHFMNEYKSLFGEVPGLIEIQAYDSGLILRQLILEGANSRDELLKKMTQLKDFPGSIGYLSVSEEREISRPLTLLTLEKGEIQPYFKEKEKNF